MNKRGQGLSMNVIALALLVLFIISILFIINSPDFKDELRNRCNISKNNVSVWEGMMMFDDNCECYFDKIDNIDGLYYNGELIRNESKDQNLPYGNIICEEKEWKTIE